MQSTPAGGQISDALPFLGVLLSVALLPIVAPRLWERRTGAIATIWCAATLIPLALRTGIGAAAAEAWHAVLVEYLPFITLLIALYATGGGVLIRGGPWGTPSGNTLLLAIGTLMAGLVGTTGAAMTLIHPFLRANAHRTRKVHLAVFFIALVANAGGATSPLGGPPLYIGYLRGVPFFWPTRHLAAPLAALTALLLVAFYLLDRRLAAGDPPPQARERLHVRGWVNLGLLVSTVLGVLAEGAWQPGRVVLFRQAIDGQLLASVGLFCAITAASVWLTPRAVRGANMFDWAPMQEVAKLFLAIFVTIGPVMGLLHAGLEGPIAPLLRLTLAANGAPLATPMFWLSGGLSAFLDNAPTYLVFFELAGGDPSALTGKLAHVLTALSAGSMFFGGMTYIGNAPNLLIRAIASYRGVRMPSFFGYMAWTSLLLLPAFLLLTAVFF
ncbi:MAG TPA: sodium:proton antiporter [Acidisphaera sp.]|nr:sodium:proton antiporter [Acidisphaera sp.]